MNGRRMKESFESILMLLAVAAKREGEGRMQWQRLQSKVELRNKTVLGDESPSQKFTSFSFFVCCIFATSSHFFRIAEGLDRDRVLRREATGTKGERRSRRIFVRFKGSGCLLLEVVAACLHSSSPAGLLLLLPSNNATLQPLRQRPLVLKYKVGNSKIV